MTEESSRKEILDAAIRDPELVATVPPIVAAAFGVVPIYRQGRILTVACFPGASRDVLKILRDVVNLEVIATPFDERALHQAITRAYFPNDESINFPTFLDADFLNDPKTPSVLRQEKVEPVGQAEIALDPERLLLATLTYRGRLWNLDYPRAARVPDAKRTKLELRDDPLLFGRDPSGRPVVHAGEGVPPELPAGTVGLLTEFRFSDHHHLAPGTLYAEHVVRSTVLHREAFPYVVHPTEVQITRIERDGSIVFHAYDREQIAPPGRPSTFRLVYYFLSYGSRLRREIEIAVHEVDPALRAAVEVRSGAALWTPDVLARWFGI